MRHVLPRFLLAATLLGGFALPAVAEMSAHGQCFVPSPEKREEMRQKKDEALVKHLKLTPERAQIILPIVHEMDQAFIQWHQDRKGIFQRIINMNSFALCSTWPTPG